MRQLPARLSGQQPSGRLVSDRGLYRSAMRRIVKFVSDELRLMGLDGTWPEPCRLRCKIVLLLEA